MEWDDWEEYERLKAQLREMELGAEEYERRLAEITGSLGI